MNENIKIIDFHHQIKKTQNVFCLNFFNSYFWYQDISGCLSPPFGPSGPRYQNVGQILADFTLRNQQILIFFARLRRVLAKFTLRNQQIALFFRAPAARSSQIYP